LRYLMHQRHPALEGVHLVLRDVQGGVLDTLSPKWKGAVVMSEKSRRTAAWRQAKLSMQSRQEGEDVNKEAPDALTLAVAESVQSCESGAGEAEWVAQGMQSLRFLNCEMYYTPRQLNLLMAGLAASPPQERANFFEACMQLRKRQRAVWTGTPLAKVFTDAEEWYMLRPRALIDQVKADLVFQRGHRKAEEILRETFNRWDTDHDGLIEREELRRAPPLRGFTASDLAFVLNLAASHTTVHEDVCRVDGSMDFESFCEIFHIEDPVEDPELLAAQVARDLQAAFDVENVEVGMWKCRACTLNNDEDEQYCRSCDAPKLQQIR